MSLGDPYITGAQLGGYMDGIDLTVTDAVRDAELASAAAAASRDITKVTGRDFNQASTPSARTFLPKASTYVPCDDFFTAAGLSIQVTLNGQPQGDPLTSTQYELLPLNGIVDGEARPYTGFRLPYPFYRFLFPYNRIQITAQWGWAAIPADIIQATKIRAAELYKLRDAPLGVVQVGSGNAGYTLKARQVPHWRALACAYARSEKVLYLG